MSRGRLCVAVASLLLLARCDSQTNSSTLTSTPPPPPLVRSLALPSAEDSGEPHLFTLADGRVLLSWLEKRGTQSALRMAVHDGVRWSQPLDVTVGDRLLVNWADFPSIIAGPDRTLFAHWLEKAKLPHAYNVRMARSSDEGRSWSAPVMLHDDATETEHGFVSMVPDPKSGAVAVTWLDGRRMKEGAHEDAGEMSLRFALVHADGRKTNEVELDGRTCECCQTGMAMTARGPVIVYRDRSEGEIRDTSMVRWQQNGWTAPASVHSDGWKIAGCPVNGPQIDARGERAAVAWFTAGGEGSSVFVAFSSDSGVTFRPPVRVDDGNPVGRVDIAMLEDGSALVSWLEKTAGGAEIRLRKVRGNGVRGESQKLGSTSAARSAGFPRMAVSGGTAYVAWTEPAEPARLRAVIVDVKGLNR